MPPLAKFRSQVRQIERVKSPQESYLFRPKKFLSTQEKTNPKEESAKNPNKEKKSIFRRALKQIVVESRLFILFRRKKE